MESYTVIPDYETRFIQQCHSAELVNLYHLARSAGAVSKYDRMLWASKEFAKLHPKGEFGGVSSTGAYKDLEGLLQ